MKYLSSLFLLAAFAFPVAASAATNFEVTGWIPYWRAATGTADVLPNLSKLTEVNPFVYTIKSDGTLFDNGSINQEPWLSFIAAAKAQKVRVIPTVMTSDKTLMHNLLSDPALRANFIAGIVAEVNAKGLDGIDIDFEGKSAADKDNFSAFLKALHEGMGSKWVMCTIESRTPVADRYYNTEIPADAGIFANDLKAINQYCDRVRLMVYDQQGIDLKLADEAQGRLYAPNGDPAWVEKVVNLMSQDISKDKILIGVPTYGYEYAVTTYANNQHTYDILWTFNPGYAWPLAQQYHVTPERTYWGEMAFTYVPLDNSTTTAPVSSTPMTALAASAAASQIATQNNTHLTYRYVVWPDAQSMQLKIDLAKRLGVRGISIFKLDGGEDPATWNVLAGVAQQPTSVETPGASSTPTPSDPGTTPSVSGSITRSLSPGMTHAEVRILQRILNANTATRVSASGVGSSGRETTYFGAATLNALKRFQVKYGIAKPGVAGYGTVGPKTRAKLNAILANL